MVHVPDITLLKRHKTDLESKWRRFRDFRGEDGRWTRLLRRRDVITLSEDLAEYGEGIDIQSAVLEEEAILRKHILSLNPAKIDVVSQEDGTQAADNAEELRIWFASLLMRLDADGAVSDVISADQVMHGVSFWRKTWEIPEESPDIPEGDAEARREYFAKRNISETFNLKHVPVGGFMFMPLSDPVVCLEDVEIDYLEWRQLKGQNGKYATLDEAGKVLFLGESHQTDTGTATGKKLHLLRHAYREPGTDKWKVCEYLSLDGKAETSELMDEYDSPGGMPYEICPGGDEMRNESDPHLRYRPMLYSLYTVVGELNYSVTILMAWSRKRLGTQSIYCEIGAVNENGRAVLEGLGLTLEGAGAETRMVFEMQEPGSRKVMIAPKLSEVPMPRPDELIMRIGMLGQEILRLRSSRFISGAATAQEVTQGTATAITSQTQQASIPYSASVKKQSSFWRRYFAWVRACILFWDEGVPEGAMKLYPILTSGDEPTYGQKGDPGKVLYINAEKIGRKFETLVYIRNVTEREQAERDARALIKWDRGLINTEQLLDEMGFEDPGKQMRELNKERHRRQYRERYTTIEISAVDTLLSATTGINLGALAANAAPQSLGGNGAGQPQLPQGAQPIQPPPMTSPEGNSSALAGQMM